MGYSAGRILRVDLSSEVISEEDAAGYEERFIGGRGVGAWIIFNEMSSQTGATDPESIVVIDTGPLSSIFPCSGRTSISAKNCMTGGVNWSNIGGSFGSTLRRTKWSHIVIKGKAKLPVYLFIDDDRAELKSATHLWGADVWTAEDIIRDELNDHEVQTLTIGPAGENLVPMGILISNRTRAAGGGGIGCIFGSKNLKAVAVRGNRTISVSDHGRFKAIAGRIYSTFQNSQYSNSLADFGTFGTYMLPSNDACINPFRNTEDDRYENLDSSSVALDKWKILKSSETHAPCYNCPINCARHILEAKEGPFKDLKINIPEYNTFYACATRLDMRSPSNILKIFEMVSRYGLDQDATAVVISWAFQCYEKGILSKQDTDGLDLTWGNDMAVVSLVRKIAYKDGFGALLSQGSKKAAETIGKGSDYYAIHLKGQDNLDALRALKGWSFGNVVSLRGGRHLDGAPTSELFTFIPPEVGEKLFGVRTAFQPTTYEGKGKLVAWTSHFKAAVDSVGVCYFGSLWGSIEHMGPEDFAEAISAVVGREISSEEFLKVGKQIVNIEKAFNTLHAGFTRKDDYPPQIFMKEPVKSGQYKGELITKDGQDQMLDEYCDANGWDKETTWQYEENLLGLSLPEIASRLKQAGKLLIRECGVGIRPMVE